MKWSRAMAYRRRIGIFAFLGRLLSSFVLKGLRAALKFFLPLKTGWNDLRTSFLVILDSLGSFPKFLKFLLTLPARRLFWNSDFFCNFFLSNFEIQTSVKACSFWVMSSFWYSLKAIFILFLKAFGLCPLKWSGH